MEASSGGADPAGKGKAPLPALQVPLRQDTSLYVLVESARLLPKQLAGAGDVFCSLRLDELEMSRTMLACAQEQPSWHEEYHFDNCSTFGKFVVCVYCRAGPHEEKCLGLVRVNNSILSREPRERDSWFPLTSHANDTSQVLLEVLKRPKNGSLSLYVTVLEIQAPLKYRSDYVGSTVFMEVLVGNAKRKTKKRTKAQPWDGSNFAGEPQIEFSLDWADKDTVLCVKVFLKRLLGSTLLGKVTARLSDFPANEEHLSYYDLRNTSDVSPLGSLRLKYKYTEDFILPLSMYDILLDLLLRDDLMVIRSLAAAAEERADIARTLVRIFEAQGVAVKCVLAMCMVEVDKTDDRSRNTLFRSNSLATKAMDMFLKLFGLEYLKSTLVPIIRAIYSGGPCEVDPDKHPDGAAGVTASLECIAGYYRQICDSIFSTPARCPPRIRQLLHGLRKATTERFGEDISLMAICSFLFLRFFCPACLSPKVYGLHPEHPTRETSKVLMHVAKLLQLTSVGAHSTLADGPLEPLQPLVDSMRPRMRQYLLEASESAAGYDIGGGVEVDLVVEMAAIHRHMRRCRTRLLAENSKHPTMITLASVLDDLDRKIAVYMNPIRRPSQGEPWKVQTPEQHPRLRSMYKSLAGIIGTTPSDPTKQQKKTKKRASASEPSSSTSETERKDSAK